MLSFNIMSANDKAFLIAIDLMVKYWALVPVYFKWHKEYNQALDCVLQRYCKENF